MGPKGHGAAGWRLESGGCTAGSDSSQAAVQRTFRYAFTLQAATAGQTTTKSRSGPKKRGDLQIQGWKVCLPFPASDGDDADIPSCRRNDDAMSQCWSPTLTTPRPRTSDKSMEPRKLWFVSRALSLWQFFVCRRFRCVVGRLSILRWKLPRTALMLTFTLPGWSTSRCDTIQSNTDSATAFLAWSWSRSLSLCGASVPPPAALTKRGALAGEPGGHVDEV